MPINYVISDWNGTLFEDKDEGNLWKYVGMSALKDSLLLGCVPTPRTFGLFAVMLGLKKLSRAYKHGEIGYEEIYRVFNDDVLSSLPPATVKKYTDAYARKSETQAKVDSRLIKPIATALEERRLQSAILSTGYNYGILRVLGVHNFGDETLSSYPFVKLIANSLLPSNGGSMFDLRIYTRDDKLRAMILELFTQAGFTPQQTLFIGNDESDEKCMEFVKSHSGRVAVPFFADDAFGQRIARTYDAFVPASEQDFLDFLRKA